MNLRTAIDPASAYGKAQALPVAAKLKPGRMPNMMCTLAIASGREAPALAVAHLGESRRVAHMAIGGMVGRSLGDFTHALQASRNQPKTTVLRRYARSMSVDRGAVIDGRLAFASAAGVVDGEVVETATYVVPNVLTNYLRQVASLVVGFPAVASSSAASRGRGACQSG